MTILDRNGWKYVMVTAFKARFIDPENCENLHVVIAFDNLCDRATFDWQVASDMISTLIDDNYITTGNNIYDHGTIEITGTDYTSWSGTDQTFPYTFVAGILGLTIL